MSEKRIFTHGKMMDYYGHFGEKARSGAGIWLKKSFVTLLFILFPVIILSMSLRGLPGNPTTKELLSDTWTANGPFELSPERGRYALLYSIAEYNSFYFTKDIADFAAPDVGFHNGRYVSLFAPGVSYLVMPGYFLGKYFGAAQVGTSAVIAVFAVLNAVLIRAIAKRLGANGIAATVAAFGFVFASPAFTYAVSIYQHHASTFLILASVYLLLRFRTFWSLCAIWFLIAAAVPVDYPNLIFMLPVGSAAFARLFIVEKSDAVYRLRIKLLGIVTCIFAVLPLAFFLWFNQQAYGNPFQLSGTVQTAVQAKEDAMREKDEKTSEKSVGTFFESRNILNGAYTHLLSPDRGIIFYTPFVLFGFAGLWYSLRKQHVAYTLLLSILGFTVLLYSMWGDPYGGWAFGSRYLIPAYAILAIFTALLLTRFRRNTIFLTVFFVVLTYSVAVNALGALTSSKNPPKIEAEYLSSVTQREEKYTYERNIDFLLRSGSKSFVYQTYIRQYMRAVTYFLVIAGTITAINLLLLIRMRYHTGGQE